ncbi:MAG: class I SAM-dependent methyltransferase [Arenimonas sp.]
MNWRELWRRAPAPAAPALTPSEIYTGHAPWLAFQRERHDLAVERHLELARMQARSKSTFQAWCSGCQAPRDFPVEWRGRGAIADFRELLACPSCRLNGRQRAALGLLRDRVPDEGAAIYATEQASSAYLWLRSKYRGARGSEYGLGDEEAARINRWLARQGVRESLELQDVTALTFADASLDAIVSFDVLEHVPKFGAALREFVRCLRPGGWLFATAPFIALNTYTEVRARMHADGTIEHLLPPEMHGDPLSDGVLCYYHFGWDLLDRCRDAGFADAAWHFSWDPAQALFGMWTLVARKGGTA